MLLFILKALAQVCVNGLFDALPWAAFAVCVLPAAGFCLQLCCWPGRPGGGDSQWHPRCLEIRLKVRVQPARQGVGLGKCTFWFQGGGKRFMRPGNTALRPFSTGILASPSPGVYRKCGFPVALWGEIGIWDSLARQAHLCASSGCFDLPFPVVWVTSGAWCSVLLHLAGPAAEPSVPGA